MIKKVFALILGISLIAGLAGCGQSNANNTAPQANDQNSNTESSKEQKQESKTTINEVDFHGYHFKLPAYFTLDDNADLSSSMARFNIIEGDYDHYAYADLYNNENMISSDAYTYADFKQEIVAAHKEEGDEIIESEDIDVAGVDCLYIDVTYEENDTKAHLVEFYIYNPDNGDVIEYSVEEYPDEGYETVIPDFKVSIANITKLDSEKEASGVADDEMRPEFKKTMDDYDAFMVDYCDFMNEYLSSDDPDSLMDQYKDYVTKYDEYLTTINGYNQNELTSAEFDYYTEVTSRAEEELLKIGQ